MYALNLNNVTKEYNKFKLNGISLAVPKGSVMGIVGENGAGKTTTIKAILDLIRIDKGTIEVLGKQNIRNNRECKSDIGVVFEGTNFNEELKVKEVHKIMSRIYKDKWERDKFNRLIDQFRLPLDKKLKEFSRGMKMKLSIAVALSHQAKLLILDEATSGLDPVARDNILDLFMEFMQDEEHSIFFSSHITSDLERIADYITFLNKGNIVFSESKDELIYNYGIVKCTQDQFDKMDKQGAVAVRRNSFGCEVLIKNKAEAEMKSHHYVIDPATIEEIMVFYVKGEQL